MHILMGEQRIRRQQRETLEMGLSQVQQIHGKRQKGVEDQGGERMKCWYLLDTECDRKGDCEGCPKYQDWHEQSKPEKESKEEEE